MAGVHMERIVGTDFLATAVNQQKLNPKERIVDLACGHKAVTSAWHKCTCPRCAEMFKRSIADGSEDWDAFRHMGAKDQMAWKDDPCRLFNEPADLGGDFLRFDDWVQPPERTCHER